MDVPTEGAKKPDARVAAVRAFCDKTFKLVREHAPTFYANYLQHAKIFFERKTGKDVPKESLRDFESFSILEDNSSRFGRVLLARQVKTGERFVLKEQDRNENFKHQRWPYVEESMKRLHVLRNSFIVKTLSMFKDGNFLYQKMKYALYGDLERNFCAMRLMKESEKQFKYIAAQVVLALEYLKGCGILHNDVRMANILLFEDGYIKLTGFAYSQAFDETCRPPRPFAPNLAPEVITSSQPLFAADWWSLGVLIHHMLLARIPFIEDNEKKTAENIMSAKFELSEYLEAGTLSEDGADIIRKLLVVEPRERLGGRNRFAEQVRMHPWFKDIDFYVVHYGMARTREVLLLPNPRALESSPNKSPEKGKSAEGPKETAKTAHRLKGEAESVKAADGPKEEAEAVNMADRAKEEAASARTADGPKRES